MINNTGYICLDPWTGHYPGAVSMNLATTLIDKDNNRLHRVEKLCQSEQVIDTILTVHGF